MYTRICPNKGCGIIIHYNSKDSYRLANKNESFCMKCAQKLSKNKNPRYLNTDINNNVLNIYYDKSKTLKKIAVECNISFTTLLKIIKNNNLPMLKRQVKHIDRNESFLKMFKTKYGIEYKDYLETKSEFEKYRARVKYYTNKTLKTYSNFFTDLDKIGKSDTSYHVDHIVSVKECFLNKVEPIITADFINLRIIPRYENLSKGSKSLFSCEILVKNVNERNNNKIKISNIWTSS
jgi:hypothetical protein